MLHRFRYLLIALSVMIGSILLSYISIIQQLLRSADLRIYDTMMILDYTFTKDESKGVYDNICIVDIDEKSIAELGQYSAWPSLLFADLLNTLSSDAPMAVALDIFFSESDSIQGYTRERLLDEMQGATQTNIDLLNRLSTDDSLADAMYNAGNVFLAMFNSDFAGIPQALPDKLKAWDVAPERFLTLSHPNPPIPIFADAAYGIGFAHVEPDASGLIHDFPLFLGYGKKSYLNFSTQMCLDLLGINRIKLDRNCNFYDGNTLVRTLPLSPDGRYYLKYYGPYQSFRYISFSDVIMNRVAPGYFNNKIILVGTSAAGLRDIKSTPLDQYYPGIELHATFLRNVLDSDFIHWVNPWIILLINISFLLIMAFIIPIAKPLLSITLFIIISILSIPATYFLYSLANYTFPYTSMMIPWIFGFTALFTTQAHEQGVEKKKVRNAFEHYVSKEVIGQIMKGKQSLTAGGEKKTISIMFVDIRNFTHLCEKLSPAEITTFINQYFNLATDVIMENRGLLDKYIGDAILGLFGAPLSYPGFEENAVKTAITIRRIGARLRDEYKEHLVLKDFQIGVGVATGEVIVGNIGSDKIFNYTGIGDRMNFSSRLEGLNKVYNTSIIIDENTYLAVSKTFFCRKLDRVRVKGKSIESDIYEVIDSFADLSEKSLLITTFKLYETALGLINNKDREQAKEHFRTVLSLYPDDVPSKIMLERLEIINWETWGGVWQYDNK